MSTLKVTNLQHPSAASANVTLNSDGSGISGVASVNGGALNSSNILINGAFTIAQRSTSETGVASNGYHTVDRWSYNDDTTGVLTMSQDTNAPDGFAYSFKSLVTTADTSIGATEQTRIEQRIESSSVQHLKYGTSDAQQVTVSFWVKTNKTGNWSVGLYMEGSGANISQAYTVNSADTWEYKTVTFAGNTANSMSSNLRLWFTFAAGTDRTSGTSNTWSTDTGHRAVGQSVNLFDATSNYWQVTGVMLEVGDTATSYQHESVGTTLSKCQRYYEEINIRDIVTNLLTSYNLHAFTLYYKTKRDTPSIASVAVGNYQPGGGSGTAAIWGSTYVDHVRIQSGSTSTSFTHQFVNADAIMKIDAEL